MRLLVFLLGMALPVCAQTVVPERTIRPHSVIAAGDVALRAGAHPSGFARLADVIGQEARVALYPGRPILLNDIGPPALVTRNQLVRLIYNQHGLRIVTEGRALERGARGDPVRAMNLSSRTTIVGTVQEDGSLRVRQ